MKKLLYLIPILLLVFLATSCKSKKDKTVSKVMRNKEECIQILRSTGRPGMENVIRQLEMSDFFTRGAGGHHTEEGGLVQHSLEVYRIMRVIACFFPSDSIAIVAIFHDLGKIDNGGWHPWHSGSHLRDWGLEMSEREYNAIYFHHTLGWKYVRAPLRFTLSVADVISTGWWKLWHKAPEGIQE